MKNIQYTKKSVLKKIQKPRDCKKSNAMDPPTQISGFSCYVQEESISSCNIELGSRRSKRRCKVEGILVESWCSKCCRIVGHT